MRKGFLFGWVCMMALGAAACGGGGDTNGSGATGGGGTSTTTSPGGGGTAGGGTAGDGGTTGGGGTGGSGGTLENDLAGLNDEFDAASSLSDWSLLHEELGEPVPYTLLDIDTTAPGKLTIEPTVSAWYMAGHATFLYKEVTGDFVVEVDVAAYQKGTQSDPPTSIFNSGGMMLRSPASGPGNEDWIMYNIGFQDAAHALAVEGKSTNDSNSQLILISTPPYHAARLRLCRIGNTVHMLRLHAGDATWNETHTFPDTFDAAHQFTLPDTLQVGMIDNAYTSADVRLEFEHIHFARVHGGDAAQCTAD